MVLGRVVILDTVCFKNFDEIALSCMVKETEAIWCFAILGMVNFWGNWVEQFAYIPKEMAASFGK